MRAQRALLAAMIVLTTLTAAAPAAPAGADAIQAHLQAGEFAPAEALIGDMNDPADRDAWLVRLATEQARAGARAAALDTAAAIRDDRQRSRLVGDLAAQPIPPAAGGGAAEADFETLIDLIKSTVAPETWDDVGGPGAADGFPGGVYVDPSGVLHKLELATDVQRLVDLRASSTTADANHQVRAASALRKVSLTRLEREIELLAADGRRPTEAMQVLAGLQRIQYVMIYPEQGDVVLAGPAGDWRTDAEGRIVAADSGRPLVRLDDLVVVLRGVQQGEGRFGCSITPTQQSLADAKAFLANHPLGKQKRDEWLAQLRAALGNQQIEVYGIDPASRAARVLVEADYRMKLVGMGLEEGTLGVTSYLDMIEVSPEQGPPPMEVLRWWFTLNYDAIQTTPGRGIFQIDGQGVQVLSENELLTQRGDRVHTGKSTALNTEFAHAFTRHFDRLAEKYPIYAELQNVFDLALVAALLHSEDVPGQLGWHLLQFGPEGAYTTAQGAAATEVATVVNHRVVRQKVGGKTLVHTLAGVSGGVTVDPRPLVQGNKIRVDTYGVLQAHHAEAAVPDDLPRRGWWWD